MKMKDSGDTLKRALVYTVLGFFTVGVIAAGWLTYGFSGPPRPDAMPDVKMWPRARSTAALPAMRIAGHWPDRQHSCLDGDGNVDERCPDDGHQCT